MFENLVPPKYGIYQGVGGGGSYIPVVLSILCAFGQSQLVL